MSKPIPFKVVRPLALFVVDEDGGETQIELTDGILKIGRAADNDVVLPGAEKGVSRAHAELRIDNNRCVIVDLQSQNGTWLNGIRVQRAEVQTGSDIVIGSYHLTLKPAPLPSRIPPPPTFDPVLSDASTAAIPISPATPREPVQREIGSRRKKSRASLFIGIAAIAIGAFVVGRFVAPAPGGGQAREGIQRAARGATDAGRERAAVGDWLGALRKYSEARDIDPNTPGLDAAVAEVWDKMHAAGNSAFEHAVQYETDGRLVEAAAEYEHAAEWLPVEAPNRAIARDRGNRLKATMK